MCDCIYPAEFPLFSGAAFVVARKMRSPIRSGRIYFRNWANIFHIHLYIKTFLCFPPNYVGLVFAVSFANHSKKFRRSVQRGPSGSNDLLVGRPLNCFFFFGPGNREVARRGQIRRIGWVIKTLEALVGQFLVGCKCPVSRTLSCKNKTPFMTFSRRFSFKMSFSCTKRDK